MISPARTNPAHRRYVWRVAAAMSGYVVTLLLAEYLIEDLAVSQPLAVLAAIVPALFVAGVFWAVARLLIEEQDEYLRALLARQVLFASGLTLTAATLWGFLEDFGLAPNLPAWYIAPFFFFSLGIGAVFNRLTLGDAGGGC